MFPEVGQIVDIVQGYVPKFQLITKRLGEANARRTVEIVEMKYIGSGLYEIWVVPIHNIFKLDPVPLTIEPGCIELNIAATWRKWHEKWEENQYVSTNK